MSRRNLVVFAFAIAGAGCSVFDPALYQAAATADAGTGGGGSGGSDAAADAAPDTAAGPDSAEPALMLGDSCQAAPLLGSSSSMAHPIDTTTLAGDYSELQACVGHDLPGNDGFIAVDMKAGEKWHFHVNPLSPDFDPAVYVLASCDPRACSAATAIDGCGPGKSEHLSFVAPGDGRYYLVVDSAKGGGGPATVVIIKPTCGNGVTEHSETCDDNNTVSNDGCDSLCRKELATAIVSEAEPNDDPRAANVLRATGTAGGMKVTAQLATRCDHDLYSVTVAQGGSIRARVGPINAPCSAEGAQVRLVLFASDAQTEIGQGTPVAADDCPALDERHAFAQALPAGEYFLQVTRTAGEMAWPYQISVETP
jgi:cysteine-rich repeat protein